MDRLRRLLAGVAHQDGGGDRLTGMFVRDVLQTRPIWVGPALHMTLVMASTRGPNARTIRSPSAPSIPR